MYSDGTETKKGTGGLTQQGVLEKGRNLEYECFLINHAQRVCSLGRKRLLEGES